MRIILFGNPSGIRQLLRHVPSKLVIAIIGAVIRPEHNDLLKEIATELGVPFLIHLRLNDQGYNVYKKKIAVLQPDLLWVNSYSMIIRDDIINLANLGGINIHGALLPQYRGCNPTQWAILQQENETGVTMHEMIDGIDEGPIIDQRKVPLFFEDTWKKVKERIFKVTDDLISKNLADILLGEWTSKPQERDLVHYCRRRKPDDSEFQWSEPVVSIYNKIRALIPPLPPAFYLDRNKKKIALEDYLTLAEITLLKYSECVGGGSMDGNKICLRPLKQNDTELLYQYITDRDLFIQNAPYYPVSESDHRKWIDSMMHKRNDLVIFVIDEIEAKQAIGTCKLFNINWRHRSAELQIRIGDDNFRGKGLGTEAVNLLCSFGFDDLNLHRIYLHVFETNKRAFRTYEKCGFKPEGLLRQAAYIDGKWLDVHIMSMLRKSI